MNIKALLNIFDIKGLKWSLDTFIINIKLCHCENLYIFLPWQLLVALVSSYRYEGLQVNVRMARSEARTLGIVIKSSNKKNLIEDDKILRILSIRSKLHLKAVVKFYKEIYGNDIYEVYNQHQYVIQLSFLIKKQTNYPI